MYIPLWGTATARSAASFPMEDYKDYYDSSHITITRTINITITIGDSADGVDRRQGTPRRIPDDAR